MELITTVDAFAPLQIIRTGRSTSLDKALVFQRQSNVSPVYISFADGYYFDLGIIIMKFRACLSCLYMIHSYTFKRLQDSLPDNLRCDIANNGNLLGYTQFAPDWDILV